MVFGVHRASLFLKAINKLAMKDIKPRYKYRFVQQFGKLKQANGEWCFTANPLVDCPVKLLSNRSKWAVIDTLFDAIKSYR